jgi:hypothetical protein
MDRYILRILKVKDGETNDKGVLESEVTIEEARVKPAIAAGLGLAQPRQKKEKVVPTARTPKAT